METRGEGSDAGRTPAQGRREIARSRRVTSTHRIQTALVIRRLLAIPPREARCALLRFSRASLFSPSRLPLKNGEIIFVSSDISVVFFKGMRRQKRGAPARRAP